MINESRGLLTLEAAEMLAVDALTWLAGEPEALARFLSLSGIDAATLRSAAADPGFLVGILDFITGDEALLMAYSGQAGIRPERVVAAQRTLNRHD
jgi:hypothetical protein